MKPMKNIFAGRIRSSRRAFTLIELLVVIAIIAILASFTLVVLKSAARRQKISVARSELAVIQTALENYHDKYNTYPPGSGYGALENQLYYELSGAKTVVIGGVNYYQTLDSSATIRQSDYKNAFKVDGLLNCTKGSAEDAVPAQDFLPGLKPNQIGSSSVNGVVPVTNLVTAVGGPDDTYEPLSVKGVNPFRYLFPGTNNPGGYDLWVQLVISGKTNLVCNWNSSVQINTSLP
ncbi:MAG TPA: type II secretion system protein [Verrucomicrobiae bacterium]